MYKRLLFLFCFLLISSFAFSQVYTVNGTVTGSDSKEGITGATVSISPGGYGAITDKSGDYSIKGVKQGTYTLKVDFIGYSSYSKEITVNGDLTVNVALQIGNITTDVIEINRAVDRETPVSFTDVDQKTLESRMQGQDAPLLLRNVPGFYSYSTDGVGNGEGKLLIRGFNQNYVQVLINGIPTNDPESNSVYWSNWGSVSANAQSIQIQRGAGSSLYGSGSFGGSFNILTEIPGINRFLGLKGNIGDPKNTMYGVNLSTGLLGKFTGALNVERKIGEGSRVSGRYEGLNYYMSVAFLPTSNQSLQFVLHGAPQSHGYSWSNDIGYFKKFGYKANPAPIVTRDIANQWDAKYSAMPDATSRYRSISDGVRELADDNFVNLSHNMFHKPQVELHWTNTLKDNSIVKIDGFWTAGRGGGSSINSNGTVWSWKNGKGANGLRVDTLLTNYYGSEGYINSFGVFDTIYSKNAVQKNSYSLHNQEGILASYEKSLTKNFKITGGAEFRYWQADHPGYFTNLFGKTSSTQKYAYADTAGKVTGATFSRTVYQGDIDGPNYDWGADVFGWNSDGDPTYKSQYRNYHGKTPQFTFFAQENWVLDKFNIMGSLQYVWYQYKLTESMPSENAIGQKLTVAQATSLNLTSEGAIGNTFYMKGTDNRWYSFNLVNETRSRGFFQPKVGINYNATKNFNVFGNFAHVERFVDLGVYYNQGRVNPNAEDEKSNQFELGMGWNSYGLTAKLNSYYMVWDNKSASIQDQSMAGQPGYDRNGFRTELVGTSRHMGLEFELGYSLDKLLPVKGFGVKGTVTYMDNKWLTVLDNVKTDPITGKRRPFNTGALNADGNVDTLYFDQLEGKPVASGPQFMSSLSLTYDREGLFGSIDMSVFGKDYLLDGGSYMATDGIYVGTDSKGRDLFQNQFADKLPNRILFDLNAGYNFFFGKKVPLKGTITGQILNLFDTEYLASADRSGVIPGMKRAYRLTLSLGF